MNDQELKSSCPSQPADPCESSLQQLRRDASSLRRTIMRRNLLEYAAGTVAIAAFGYFAWAVPGVIIMRIGCGLMIVGILVVMVQLHRHLSNVALPPEQLTVPSVAYLRQQLERQRDAMRSVSRWYIGPIVPGSIVFIWGIPRPNPADFPWVAASILFISMLAVTTKNDTTASQLQRKIDELDGAEPY